jgi:hypothetical protein
MSTAPPVPVPYLAAKKLDRFRQDGLTHELIECADAYAQIARSFATSAEEKMVLGAANGNSAQPSVTFVILWAR